MRGSWNRSASCSWNGVPIPGGLEARFHFLLFYIFGYGSHVFFFFMGPVILYWNVWFWMRFAFQSSGNLCMCLFFLFDFPSIFPIYPLLMMFHLRSDASLHSHLLTWVWRIPYAVVPFLHTRSRYRSLLAFLYDPDVSRSSHDFVPRG